jgi:hypothetical protein
MNICCEERDDDRHDCMKKFMSLKIFGVMVTNIDRQKSEEERLSLKMMADTLTQSKILKNIGCFAVSKRCRPVY